MNFFFFLNYIHTWTLGQGWLQLAPNSEIVLWRPPCHAVVAFSVHPTRSHSQYWSPCTLEKFFRPLQIRVVGQPYNGQETLSPVASSLTYKMQTELLRGLRAVKYKVSRYASNLAHGRNLNILAAVRQGWRRDSGGPYTLLLNHFPGRDSGRGQSFLSAVHC